MGMNGQMVNVKFVKKLVIINGMGAYVLFVVRNATIQILSLEFVQHVLIMVDQTK